MPNLESERVAEAGPWTAMSPTSPPMSQAAADGMGDAGGGMRPILPEAHWRLARAVARRFPTHRTYVELTGGGAPALLWKPRAPFEVYADARGALVELLDVLRDPHTAVALARAVALTPMVHHPVDHPVHHAVHGPEGSEGDGRRGSGVRDASVRHAQRARAGAGRREATETATLVERARQTLLAAGLGLETMGVREALSTSAAPVAWGAVRAWSRWPAGVPGWAARLAGVVLEHAAPARVVGDYDGPETLFYARVAMPEPGASPGGRARRRPRRPATGRSAPLDDRLLRALQGAAGMVVLVTGGQLPDAIADALGARGWTVSDELADLAAVRLWRNPAGEDGWRDTRAAREAEGRGSPAGAAVAEEAPWTWQLELPLATATVAGPETR